MIELCKKMDDIDDVSFSMLFKISLKSVEHSVSSYIKCIFKDNSCFVFDVNGFNKDELYDDEIAYYFKEKISTIYVTDFGFYTLIYKDGSTLSMNTNYVNSSEIMNTIKV